MENKPLTGIERELVLRYLLDGNVPVTVTPVESVNDSGEIRSLSSEIFPVAIKPDNISVLKEGIILLINPPKSIIDFEGRTVRVEFYFNRVGLYFVSEMKRVSSGPALVIPECIYRIEDIVVKQKYDFSAVLYYSVSSGKDVNFTCSPADGFKLFSRPVWADIKLEKQRIAKSLLETFVVQAKKNAASGNGLQLISICRYLTEDKSLAFESVENRVHPFDILFVNHERIVVGFGRNPPIKLADGEEYALKMSFSLKDSPAVMRDVYVTCAVSNVYANADGDANAADCSFTSIQEEDLRFLYEKTTSTIMI